MAVKILVADDSATMRKIMEMTFAGQDAEVETVDSGDAAIAKARELQPGVIFADASMPGTDGYEVARTVKTDSSLSGTAVLVLASQHTPYDAEKGGAAGVDDHVLKPFDSQQVIDKVLQLASQPRAAPAAAGGRPQPPAPPAGGSPSQPAAQQTQGGPPPPQPPAQQASGGGAKPPPAPPAARSGGQRSPKSTVAFGSGPASGQQPPPQPGKAGANAAAPQATPPGAKTQQGVGAGSASPGQPPPPPPSSSKTGGNQEPVLELAEEEPASGAAGTAGAASSAAAGTAAAAAAAGDGAAAAMTDRLRELGLTPDQVDGVLKLSRAVVEQVVWEVVPDLAETIIREEIRRLTSE